MRFSVTTLTPTSIDVRKTRFTEELRMINSPIWTGCRKFKLSTEAVTTGLRACRMAAMAPARSTRCMTFPPRTLPRPLASLGSASSEYSDADSLTGLPSIVSDPLYGANSFRHRPAPGGSRSRPQEDSGMLPRLRNNPAAREQTDGDPAPGRNRCEGKGPGPARP